MTYKVTVSSGNNYNVKVSTEPNLKTTFGYTVDLMPQKLDELLDVEIEEVGGKQNNYVLVYNSTTQTWQAVNPDVVLSAAATEPIQPGLPQDFVVETEQSLDIDGGGF
jgi:hypothetical protein